MDFNIFPSDDELARFRKEIYQIPTEAEMLSVKQRHDRKKLERQAAHRAAHLSGVIVRLAVEGRDGGHYDQDASFFSHELNNLGVTGVTPEMYAENPALALRFERKRLGLPQRDVADELGISVSFMSRVETGEREAPDIRDDIRYMLSAGRLGLLASSSGVLDVRQGSNQ